MSNAQNFKDLIALKTPEEPNKDKEPVEVEDEVIKEAIDTTLTSLAPTVLERDILECALKGVGVSSMSFHLGVPESHIRTYLRNPKVKAYLKELKEAVNEIDQLMITDTLRKIVQGRIDNLEDDESYADLSNKDTLDVIKTFSDLTNQIAKGQSADTDDNVFINIYQQIL